MPLTVLDIPAIAKAAGPVVKEIAKDLRRDSDGGKKITKDEARRIGEKLRTLAEQFLEAASN
jgi:hypothetical protein